MEDDARLPSDAGIGRVALRAGDLDRQVGFYEDVVGLAVRSRGDAHAVLGTPDGPLFELAERPDLHERRPTEAGLFHAAVRVPSRGALGASLERIEADWRLTGASDHLVSEALYLDDPEGNGLEIYCDRPREEWPTTADGRVAMETRPLDLDDLREAADGADRAPEETTVGHVHLEVSDLDATRQFYAEGLGMGVRQTYGTEAVFLAAGDYHHHVGANVWNGRTEPATGRGLAWFEVVVPDAETVAAARSRFEEAGAAPAETDGGFAVEDPDGIEVRVRPSENAPG